MDRDRLDSDECHQDGSFPGADALGHVVRGTRPTERLFDYDATVDRTGVRCQASSGRNLVDVRVTYGCHGSESSTRHPRRRSTGTPRIGDPADCAGRARMAPATWHPAGERASSASLPEAVPDRVGRLDRRRRRGSSAARTSSVAHARRGSRPSRRAIERAPSRPDPATSGRASSSATAKIRSVMSVGAGSVR